MSAAAVAETGLMLEGLRCAGCAHRVEEALRGAPGVVRADVNYTNHRALVEFDPATIDTDALVGEVRGLGFDAIVYDPKRLERPADRSARRALQRLLVAAFLAGNVMWLAVALYLGAIEGIAEDVRTGLRVCVLALSIPAATFCAAPFWQGALSGLRRGRLSIDVPIVLGISMSLFSTAAGTLAGSDDLYVDSAAMIVFLILLGRTLESRARARASSAVDRLAAMIPQEARRRDDAGRIESVPVEALRRGDVLCVAAGQRVACDLEILEHAVEVDESIVTGESLPVARAVGSPVPAGAVVVGRELVGRVLARADEGTVARLGELLERAQASRPKVQALADRVASVFAPAVLGVAGLAALGFFAAGLPPLDIVMRTSAVLIVACPCALGLATPAALTAAVGRAAQLGIVVKGGAALEALAGVDAMLLDKTGTLTEGHFRVAHVAPESGFDEAGLVEFAARVEGGATHPIAEALRAAAGPGVAAVASISETRPGLGVVGDDGRGRVGSLALLAEAGLRPSQALLVEADRFASLGYTIVWVARERVMGFVALWDEPRSDAGAAVSALDAFGIELGLVSGDQPTAVGLVAKEAGIGEVHAGATPEAKVEWVEDRRALGRRVAAVGDGLNDAAALGAADVGIAMARGADVTLQAADLVIRAPRLLALAEAIGLARATLSRIRENLGFALAYNAVAVPLAIAGWLGPLAAAIAMSASSLVVTVNALRLLRWKMS